MTPFRRPRYKGHPVCVRRPGTPRAFPTAPADATRPIRHPGWLTPQGVRKHPTDRSPNLCVPFIAMTPSGHDTGETSGPVSPRNSLVPGFGPCEHGPSSSRFALFLRREDARPIPVSRSCQTFDPCSHGSSSTNRRIAPHCERRARLVIDPSAHPESSTARLYVLPFRENALLAIRQAL